LTAPVVAALHRARAIALLAALMMIAATVSLTAQPASAASEYTDSGSPYWQNFVHFQTGQFYCTPGRVGTFGPTVSMPGNMGSDVQYIAMFGIESWDGKQWNQILPPTTIKNNGIEMYPGESPQVFPFASWSVPLHGYYYVSLQIQIYAWDVNQYGRIEYVPTQASDYFGGYGAGYYCRT
jgi:hypothetical protein